VVIVVITDKDVLEKFKSYLEYESMSAETTRKYLNIAKEFLKSYKGSLEILDDTSVMKFLMKKRKAKVSGRYQKMIYYSLQKLFRSSRKDRKYEFPFSPPKIPPGEEPRDPVFTIEQVARMLNLANDTNPMDYLILRTGYASGLGRSEMVYLNKKDLFESNGYWFLKNRWGGKDRIRNVPIDAGTAQLLKDSFTNIRRGESPLMFIYTKTRHVKEKHHFRGVSLLHISSLVKNYKDLCGIDLSGASSHTLFRRSYAMHREEMSITLYGHSSQYEIDIDLGHKVSSIFNQKTATEVTRFYLPIGKKQAGSEPDYSLKMRGASYEKTHPLALGKIKIGE